MKRRNFIKLSLATGTLLLAPSGASADVDISNVRFNMETFKKNSAQTIMIFLYGGASELAGNLSQIDAIKAASANNYDYFKGLTSTPNHFWQEAGGSYMESLLSSGDLNLFRTCYSKKREQTNNKSHGTCVAENQRGAFRTTGEGIFSILARVLEAHGAVNENTLLPFITMEGESGFYAKGDTPLSGYLNPVGIDRDLKNPYERKEDNSWFYYTAQERRNSNYKSRKASINAQMDALAQKQNTDVKLKEAFSKRIMLSDFVKNVQKKPLPSGVSYPSENAFAQKLQTAIKVLSANPETKLISLGADGLGVWDDHNDAREYVGRMDKLFAALSAAMQHIKAEGKEDTISIMIFSDFGRNVNLNNAKGWDHGNNQNFYQLGGKNFFNHVGIVGETILYNPHSIDRLYLQPKRGTYSFEPLSIAATLYKIYGIENPEVLTGGYGAIEGGLLR